MKTTRAIHQKITQLRQVVNKSQLTRYVHLVWCEACEKTWETAAYEEKSCPGSRSYTQLRTHAHSLSHTHSVYRCRLTVDGIRIGELSAVTRLRMTSMVAKHCSENSVVSLFICTPLWRCCGEGGPNVAFGEHSSLSKCLPQPTWHPRPHLSRKRTFGRWLKMSVSSISSCRT